MDQNALLLKEIDMLTNGLAVLFFCASESELRARLSKRFGLGLWDDDETYRRAVATLPSHLQDEDDKPDSAAIFELGACYDYGLGVAMNWEEAAKYYRRASELKNLDAMLSYARCFAEGRGVEPSPKKCVKMLELAAKLGSADALANLGVCHWNGIGFKQDKEAAKKVFVEASSKGSSYAYVALGRLCEDEEAWKEEREKNELTDEPVWNVPTRESRKYFLAAMNNGNPEGTFRYALTFLLDEHKTLEQAKMGAEYVTRAAQQGLASAWGFLSVLYGSGLGVPRNDSLVRASIARAATLGDAEATGKLGYAYLNGDGVPRDPRRAMDLWLRAAERGNGEAAKMLAELCANGAWPGHGGLEATRLWALAAHFENGDALLHMSDWFGAKQCPIANPKKAYRLLLEASYNQCLAASERVANLLRQKPLHPFLAETLREDPEKFLRAISFGVLKRSPVCCRVMAVFSDRGIGCPADETMAKMMRTLAHVGDGLPE